ncbi:MAG: EAL domain-containing protein [Chlamydiae bacterium]|nr:EAL domain-containing protein [Chlamydiota bacterium]MBI3266679.1 EAL domain-containing protein [Chlamydiota bacterium]
MKYRKSARKKEVKTLEKNLPKVEKALRKGISLGLVYLDVSKFWSFEEQYGWEFIDKLFSRVSEVLLHLKEKAPPFLDVLPTCRMWRDDFVVFFIPGPKHPLKWTEGLLTRVVEALREGLKEFLPKNERLDQGDLEFFSGWAMIHSVKGIPVGTLISRAIREALDFAAEQRFSNVSQLALELDEIINGGKLSTVFQPVVCLDTKTVLGYEALARGPEGSAFRNPEVIFNVAAQARSLMKVERLAKISAMEAARQIPERYKLFLNIDSELLIQPREIFKMLKEVGCFPGRVVFEITERKAVKDFEQLRSVIQMMKKEGYEFAIDDAGSGYASMESIAILDPQYIKIDQSIIRGIETHSVKQDVVKAFVNLSRMRHAILIAEGVEDEGECRMLSSLGVACAQGFFFARPAFPPPKADSLQCC